MFNPSNCALIFHLETNKKQNPHKKQKITEDFNAVEEEEVRLKDAIGHDQVSFDSESFLYAAYSPAPSRLDDSDLFEYNNYELPKINAAYNNNNQFQMNNIKFEQNGIEVGYDCFMIF